MTIVVEYVCVCACSDEAAVLTRRKQEVRVLLRAQRVQFMVVGTCFVTMRATFQDGLPTEAMWQSAADKHDLRVCSEGVLVGRASVSVSPALLRATQAIGWTDGWWNGTDWSSRCTCIPSCGRADPSKDLVLSRCVSVRAEPKRSPPVLVFEGAVPTQYIGDFIREVSARHASACVVVIRGLGFGDGRSSSTTFDIAPTTGATHCDSILGGRGATESTLAFLLAEKVHAARRWLLGATDPPARTLSAPFEGGRSELVLRCDSITRTLSGDTVRMHVRVRVHELRSDDSLSPASMPGEAHLKTTLGSHWNGFFSALFGRLVVFPRPGTCDPPGADEEDALIALLHDGADLPDSGLDGLGDLGDFGDLGDLGLGDGLGDSRNTTIVDSADESLLDLGDSGTEEEGDPGDDLATTRQRFMLEVPEATNDTLAQLLSHPRSSTLLQSLSCERQGVGAATWFASIVCVWDICIHTGVAVSIYSLMDGKRRRYMHSEFGIDSSKWRIPVLRTLRSAGSTPIRRTHHRPRLRHPTAESLARLPARYRAVVQHRTEALLEKANYVEATIRRIWKIIATNPKIPNYVTEAHDVSDVVSIATNMPPRVDALYAVGIAYFEFVEHAPANAATPVRAKVSLHTCIVNARIQRALKQWRAQQQQPRQQRFSWKRPAKRTRRD